MNQPLYTEQDNNDLNAQIAATVNTPTPETPATEVQARGENSTINYVDELAFFPADQEQKTSDIQQSTNSFTEGGIVVKAPKNPEFNLSPEMIRQAQAQLENGGAVVLGANGSSQMFNNIKDIFAENAPKTPRKREVYFVNHNTKIQFSIDRTIFEPSAIVRLSGKNFEQKYLEQLESYIFNNQDELDPEKLFALIYIIGYIKEGHFPIKLVTGKHRIQLPKIVNVFNTYFNKNRSVLFSMATMFNGMSAIQPQAEQKAE